MNARSRFAMMFIAALSFFLPLSAFAATPLTSAGIIALTNHSRAENSAGTVTEDTSLDAIAQKKAQDMLTRGYFSHNTPEGRDSWWWLKQANYYYYFAGENIAMGFTDAQSLEQAWMNSPLHRANIVNQKFTHIGVGTATGIYLGKQTTFVVEYFSTPPQDYARVMKTLASK